MLRSSLATETASAVAFRLCVFRLFTRAKHKFKTQVKQNTLHPVWNEDFRCLVHVPEQQQLTCILYDYDTLGQPDTIGEATLNIKDLKLNEKQDIWLDVKNRIGAAEDKGVRPINDLSSMMSACAVVQLVGTLQSILLITAVH